MDSVYGMMNKWKTIDLGQVFTPLHISVFAAKLLEISDDDVVLDSTAGSGALLLAAADEGAGKLCGIEYDSQVYELLQHNLSQTDVDYATICASADTEDASDWIRAMGVTKCILNPPYEKQYGTYEILLNTLNALTPGTKVVLFYPRGHLEKSGKDWIEDFRSKHTVDKIIYLPSGTFAPFASVETAIYMITAGVPQADKEIWGCRIKEDGLVRKKGKYKEDTRGDWANRIMPYWLDVILHGADDETVREWDPVHGYSIYEPPEPPTEEDFRRTVNAYLSWKISQIMQ